jgi:uncharacterized membrane protein
MIEIIPNWHPIFVHFTVGLLATATALFLLAAALPADSGLQRQAYLVAHWNLWLGYGFALATALFGWLAFNSVAHDAPSHAAMTEHRNWALATLALYLPVVAWSIARHRAGKKAHALFLAALTALTLMLASTAWHGAELVYRHGLGVLSLPAVEARESAPHGQDAHSHTESGEHSHN